MAHNGKETPLDESFISRVVEGLRYVVSGVKPTTWFGPNQPLAPVAQEVAGRQFDYPVGVNLRITPRQNEAVSFNDMRNLADGYDILRLLIEKRKDQLVRIKWAVGPVDPKQDIDNDPRIKKVQDFLRMPDRVRPWQRWLREVIEDMLVIDAATLYPRLDQAGNLFALELVDGSTIKPIIDDTGRMPPAPDPAYQQILKGVPAADYTSDQLIYAPRNTRTFKLYGYGPVEQIIMTINIAIRRQLYQLQYYTDGSVPDMILTVPSTWSTVQMAEFDAYWQAKLSGNTAERRRVTFAPQGSTAINTKEGALKDEYDEWLARVCCFAFSISPTPFIRQMNRATADNAKEAAEEEGLLPLMQWVKDLMDLVLWKYFGFTDLEFQWEEEDAIDPLQQAQIDDINIKNGSSSIDEVRIKRGEDPIGMGPAVYTASGPIMLENFIDQAAWELANPQAQQVTQQLQPDGTYAPAPAGSSTGQAAAGGKKPKAGSEASAADVDIGTEEGAIKGAYLGKRLRKANSATTIKPIDRTRPLVVQATSDLAKEWSAFLSEEGKRIAGIVSDAYVAKMLKADDATDPMNDLDAIINQIDMSGWAVMVDPTQKQLEKVGKDAGTQAFAQIGIDQTDAMVNQVNEAAVSYAENRSAEMVGMTWDDSGQLVPNTRLQPDGQPWAITDTTRVRLRQNVADAVAAGASTDELSQSIQDSYAFSDARANMIARTELVNADISGNMSAYRSSGVVKGKQWILGSAHDLDDLCDENAQAGTIDLDQQFPSGDDAPPQHPNCTCDVIPVTMSLDELLGDGNA